MTEEHQGIGKTARDERLKLRATSANAIGLAFGAVGFIQLIVAGDLTAVAAAKVAICAIIGYILHNYAMKILAKLED